ncbi:hypothetical protein PR048_029311 [Dryococelus australis]|uniref:Uncharacterized protein n=1 Tax=Dryococelus australis TaxID=614101 RepID=A0ABQ9GD13_9NEOP|nr:hypothetical protein PR048_029311 [Dryococelus australis]
MFFARKCHRAASLGGRRHVVMATITGEEGGSGRRGFAGKTGLQQPVASVRHPLVRHTFVRLPAERFTTKLRTPALAWGDFGKPWKTEIRIAGQGIEPGSSPMRVQMVPLSPAVIGERRPRASLAGDAIEVRANVWPLYCRVVCGRRARHLPKHGLSQAGKSSCATVIDAPAWRSRSTKVCASSVLLQLPLARHPPQPAPPCNGRAVVGPVTTGGTVPPALSLSLSFYLPNYLILSVTSGSKRAKKPQRDYNLNSEEQEKSVNRDVKTLATENAAKRRSTGNVYGRIYNDPSRPSVNHVTNSQSEVAINILSVRPLQQWMYEGRLKFSSKSIGRETDERMTDGRDKLFALLRKKSFLGQSTTDLKFRARILRIQYSVSSHLSNIPASQTDQPLVARGRRIPITHLRSTCSENFNQLRPWSRSDSPTKDPSLPGLVPLKTVSRMCRHIFAVRIRAEGTDAPYNVPFSRGHEALNLLEPQIVFRLSPLKCMQSGAVTLDLSAMCFVFVRSALSLTTLPRFGLPIGGEEESRPLTAKRPGLMRPLARPKPQPGTSAHPCLLYHRDSGTLTLRNQACGLAGVLPIHLVPLQSTTGAGCRSPPGLSTRVGISPDLLQQTESTTTTTSPTLCSGSRENLPVGPTDRPGASKGSDFFSKVVLKNAHFIANSLFACVMYTIVYSESQWVKRTAPVVPNYGLKNIVTRLPAVSLTKHYIGTEAAGYVGKRGAAAALPRRARHDGQQPMQYKIDRRKPDRFCRTTSNFGLEMISISDDHSYTSNYARCAAAHAQIISFRRSLQPPPPPPFSKAIPPSATGHIATRNTSYLSAYVYRTHSTRQLADLWPCSDLSYFLVPTRLRSRLPAGLRCEGHRTSLLRCRKTLPLTRTINAMLPDIRKFRYLYDNTSDNRANTRQGVRRDPARVAGRSRRDTTVTTRLAQVLPARRRIETSDPSTRLGQQPRASYKARRRPHFHTPHPVQYHAVTQKRNGVEVVSMSANSVAYCSREAVETNLGSDWLLHAIEYSLVCRGVGGGARRLSGWPARPPPRRTRFNSRPGRRIFASGNRAVRCRWSAGLLGDLPFPPVLSFRRRSILASITLIGSEDFAVKSRPNRFTHSLGLTFPITITVFLALNLPKARQAAILNQIFYQATDGGEPRDANDNTDRASTRSCLLRLITPTFSQNDAPDLSLSTYRPTLFQSRRTYVLRFTRYVLLDATGCSRNAPSQLSPTARYLPSLPHKLTDDSGGPELTVQRRRELTFTASEEPGYAPLEPSVNRTARSALTKGLKRCSGAKPPDTHARLWSIPPTFLLLRATCSVANDLSVDEALRDPSAWRGNRVTGCFKHTFFFPRGTTKTASGVII